MELLICDDDAVVRTMLAKTVAKWGYKPVLAKDGEEAWEILSRPNAPRIIVLDWMMPGMDGPELCRKLKHTAGLPFIYVIMLTSKTEKEDLVSGLDAGADEFLTKPLQPDELEGRLKVGSRIIQAMPTLAQSTELPTIPGYELGKALGRGAFGTVYRAVRQANNQEVALKIIRTDRVNDRQLTRIAREIEITTQLQHPNIVQILESFRESNFIYYAMELINGPDLSFYVERNRPPRIKLLKMMHAVCAGLAYAHERGIIHRELKFANILVDEHDVPKLVDFALGKSLWDSDADEDPMLLSGSMISASVFISPEQASQGTNKIALQSNIYSLGVMLYRLMLCQHPHKLEPPFKSMLKQIIETDIRNPREFALNIHPKLEAILLKALAKDPIKRYQNAGEMSDALRDLICSLDPEYPAG